MVKGCLVDKGAVVHSSYRTSVAFAHPPLRGNEQGKLLRDWKRRVHGRERVGACVGGHESMAVRLRLEVILSGRIREEILGVAVKCGSDVGRGVCRKRVVAMRQQDGGVDSRKVGKGQMEWLLVSCFI